MYWLIDPEMSASTTSGGWISRGGAEFRQDQFAAGARGGPHHGARIDAAAARIGPETPRRDHVERQPQRRDRSLGLADLGGAHLREILAAQHLVAGHGEARIDLDFRNFARRLVLPVAFEHRLADAIFGGARLLLFALSGATGENIASIFSISSRDFQNSRNASSKAAWSSCRVTSTACSVQ